jgi:MurNAc alpha-1-phosphate uridylyltransferase
MKFLSASTSREQLFLSATDLQCVILAGGLGTRMRGVAPGEPKSMIPVAGKPFIAWQLQWLSAQGVTDIVVCIGYRGDQIREFVQGGERFGVRVTYVDEGENLKGTAGALRLAIDEDRLRPSFLVMYGDSYLNVSVQSVAGAFTSTASPALMTVYRNHGKWEKSNVVFDGANVIRYEKNCPDPPSDMVYLDYGLLALRRDVIIEMVKSDSTSDLAALLGALSAAGTLRGFEVTERFFEIGSPEGLSSLERQLLSPPGTNT